MAEVEWILFLSFMMDGEFMNEIDLKTLRLRIKTMKNDEIPIESSGYACDVIIEFLVISIPNT